MRNLGDEDLENVEYSGAIMGGILGVMIVWATNQQKSHKKIALLLSQMLSEQKAQTQQLAVLAKRSNTP